MAESDEKVADDTIGIVRFLKADFHAKFKVSPGKKKLEGESSLQEIADLLGVKKPQVVQVMNGEGGRKPLFEERWAKKFYGSIDAFLKAARDWYRTNPLDPFDCAEVALKDAGRWRSNPEAFEDAYARLRAAVADMAQYQQSQATDTAPRPTNRNVLPLKKPGQSRAKPGL